MKIIEKCGIQLKIVEKTDVETLEVGQLAPNCFGRLSPVCEIVAKGFDINHKAYVIYYTSYGNSRISFSMREGEIIKDVSVTRYFKNDELIRIEKTIVNDIATQN